MNRIYTICKFFIGITLFSGLYFISCTEDEPEVFGNIHGFVSDASTRQHLSGASVSLNPRGKKMVTGSDGRFEYNRLEAGSYTLLISKDGYGDETVKVTVVPGETSECDIQLSTGDGQLKVNTAELNFGSDKVIMPFEINNGGQIDLRWEISSKCAWISEISPTSGTTTKGKTSAVKVTIDRSKLERNKKNRSSLAITSTSGTAEINITAEGEYDPENPNKPDPENPEEPDPTDPTIPSFLPGDPVRGGLIAYYNFNNADAKDATDNKMNGILLGNPDFLTKDTPNGKGKSIFLNSTKDQCVNIPTHNFPFAGLVDYTISLWIKDYSGLAVIITGVNSANYVYDDYPCLMSTATNHFLFIPKNDRYHKSTPFVFNHKSIQTQWHMVTVVVTRTGKSYDNTKKLYIDGEFYDSSVDNYGDYTSECTKIQIGGNADKHYTEAMSSMKVDNVRLYNCALESNDIEAIFLHEKKYE